MNIELARRGLVLAIAVLSLAACAENSIYEQPGDAAFGEANRQTMMAQVIDPDPEYSTEAPAGNGEQAAAAVERYRTRKVEEPSAPSTTRRVSSGGGSAN